MYNTRARARVAIETRNRTLAVAACYTCVTRVERVRERERTTDWLSCWMAGYMRRRYIKGVGSMTREAVSYLLKRERETGLLSSVYV